MRFPPAILCRAIAIVALAAPAMARTPTDSMVIASDLSSFVTFDPAAVSEAAIDGIVKANCDPLLDIDYDDATKIVPGLAERWEVSPDKLTYTFHLRPDMKHFSGNPVTAEDIAWTMRRTLTLNLANSTNIKQWGFAADRADTDIQAVDTNTLRVRVAHPYAPSLMLRMFTDFRISSAIDRLTVLQHEKDGDLGNAFLTTKMACAGPFSLSSFRPQEAVIMNANVNYWRNPIKIKRLIFRHVPDSGSRRLLLLNGDVDVAGLVQAADLDAVKGSSTTHFVQGPNLDTTYLALNQKDPILSQAKVRLAFKYLFDYDQLQRTVMNRIAKTRQSFVSSGAFGALPDSDQPFSLDLAKAKSLISEAGFPNGFEKVLVIQNVPPYADIAQHLQLNAGKIGIKLSIRSMAGAQLFTQHRQRDFELGLYGRGFGYPDANAMAQVMIVNPDNSDAAKLAGSTAWRDSWAPDAWFGDKVERARMESDDATRKEIYFELQRRYFEEAPQIHLFQRLSNTGISNAVKQLRTNGYQTFWATAVKE